MNVINYSICILVAMTTIRIFHSQPFKSIVFLTLRMIIVIIVTYHSLKERKDSTWCCAHTTALLCVTFDMCKCPQSYINIDRVNRSPHTTDQIRSARLYNLKHLIWHLHQTKVQEVWEGGGCLWWPQITAGRFTADLDPTATPSGEKY